MNFLFELFPVLLFFAAFKFFDIFVATGVAMAASIAQISYVWWKHKNVKITLWINLTIICVFGGLTLLLHDETFIKWKPSILYWAFAAALIFGKLTHKNFIKMLMGAQIELPEFVWNRLNSAWIIFFLSMGGLNLLIAFGLNVPTETWVNFKLFGGMGLMLLFTIAQGIWLSKYIQEKPAADKKEEV